MKSVFPRMLPPLLAALFTADHFDHGFDEMDFVKSDLFFVSSIEEEVFLSKEKTVSSQNGKRRRPQSQASIRFFVGQGADSGSPRKIVPCARLPPKISGVFYTLDIIDFCDILVIISKTLTQTARRFYACKNRF